VLAGLPAISRRNAMPASSHQGSVGSLLESFVRSVEELCNQLDFAAALGENQWPLRGRLHGLACLCLDLKAAVGREGANGARVYLVAAQARDRIATVVEAHDAGDLDPWRFCRHDVQETLATLRRFLEPQVAGELVVRSAVPSAPDPGQAPAGAAVQADVYPGGKGEKAEKGPRKVRELSGHAKTILSALDEHHATGEHDRVTRAYVCDETGLSGSIVRRAVENELKPRGLLDSKPGRDGGLWLSTQGIEAASDLKSK
jgi:hypothetical protein